MLIKGKYFIEIDQLVSVSLTRVFKKVAVPGMLRLSDVAERLAGRGGITEAILMMQDPRQRLADFANRYKCSADYVLRNIEEFRPLKPASFFLNRNEISVRYYQLEDFKEVLEQELGKVPARAKLMSIDGPLSAGDFDVPDVKDRFASDFALLQLVEKINASGE